MNMTTFETVIDREQRRIRGEINPLAEAHRANLETLFAMRTAKEKEIANIDANIDATLAAIERLENP
jgi:hypothetical protein